MFRIAIVNSFSWKSESSIDRIKMATQSVAIFFGVLSIAMDSRRTKKIALQVERQPQPDARIFVASLAAISGCNAVHAIPDTTLVMLWSIRSGIPQWFPSAVVM
jgi:hypothetical protein